jgi:large subunit ribosomal protein L35
MKSRRAAMKRYRFTGSGKVKFQKIGRRKNLHGKTEKRKRWLKRGGYLPEVLGEKVERQLPYGSR